MVQRYPPPPPCRDPPVVPGAVVGRLAALGPLACIGYGTRVDEKISEAPSGEKYPHEFQDPACVIRTGAPMPMIRSPSHFNGATYITYHSSGLVIAWKTIHFM